jgi:hypothetical protein
MNKHWHWAAAEEDADRQSQDGGGRIAVVEDYKEIPAALLVMPEAEAEVFVADPEQDAEIQYVADASPAAGDRRPR